MNGLLHAYRIVRGFRSPHPDPPAKMALSSWVKCWGTYDLLPWVTTSLVEHGYLSDAKERQIECRIDTFVLEGSALLDTGSCQVGFQVPAAEVLFEADSFKEDEPPRLSILDAAAMS
eukprot:4316427-Amphidinium_carterae.1